MLDQLSQNISIDLHLTESTCAACEPCEVTEVRGSELPQYRRRSLLIDELV